MVSETRTLRFAHLGAPLGLGFIGFRTFGFSVWAVGYCPVEGSRVLACLESDPKLQNILKPSSESWGFGL